MTPRTGPGLAACAALAMAAGTAAAAEEPIAADELSSPDWRDCAGHFFFVARMIDREADAEMHQRFTGLAYLAMYAGEEKAKAERDAGDTANGRGETLADPETGELQVDVRKMVTAHAARARAQGQGPYVDAYADKCSDPVLAFSERFSERMESGGE